MIGVCIVTYNQEKYIAKAIDSVLEQVGCPDAIKIYIGNDCSTDGTAEVCNQYAINYPGTIRLINNQENLGLVGNTINVLKAILEDGCNYVAILDGDDYWCDSLKLKKQLEYLTARPDYGFVHTRNYVLADNHLIKPQRPTPPTGSVFSSISSFPIANCTVFFRIELLKSLQLDELTTKGFMSLDYVMYVLFSSITNFGFLEDYTAVWRRGHSSVSNPNDEAKQISYLNNDKAMWQYLGEKFPDHLAFSEEQWNRYYLFRVFNIAFRFRDYSLAHSLIPQLSYRPDIKFRVKKFFARNKMLFYFWTHFLHHSV